MIGKCTQIFKLEKVPLLRRSVPGISVINVTEVWIYEAPEVNRRTPFPVLNSLPIVDSGLCGMQTCPIVTRTACAGPAEPQPRRDHVPALRILSGIKGQADEESNECDVRVPVTAHLNEPDLDRAEDIARPRPDGQLRPPPSPSLCSMLYSVAGASSATAGAARVPFSQSPATSSPVA